VIWGGIFVENLQVESEIFTIHILSPININFTKSSSPQRYIWSLWGGLDLAWIKWKQNPATAWYYIYEHSFWFSMRRAAPLQHEISKENPRLIFNSTRRTKANIFHYILILFNSFGSSTGIEENGVSEKIIADKRNTQDSSPVYSTQARNSIISVQQNHREQQDKLLCRLIGRSFQERLDLRAWFWTQFCHHILRLRMRLSLLFSKQLPFYYRLKLLNDHHFFIVFFIHFFYCFFSAFFQLFFYRFFPSAARVFHRRLAFENQKNCSR